MAHLFMRLRESLREMCLHELFITSNKDEQLIRGGQAMCPKIVLDMSEDGAVEDASGIQGKGRGKEEGVVVMDSGVQEQA